MIYINDLNHAIKVCKVHHFANDTDLVHHSKSENKLNNYINFDIKKLAKWLNANKNPLNIKKTVLVELNFQAKEQETRISNTN